MCRAGAGLLVRHAAKDQQAKWRTVNVPLALACWNAVGWPQSTNGGGSALTTAASGAGRATETGAGQMVNVPTPPGRGSACCLAATGWWWYCLTSAPEAGSCCAGDGSGGGGAPGFSNGCRKSCVFKKKLPACMISSGW